MNQKTALIEIIRAEIREILKARKKTTNELYFFGVMFLLPFRISHWIIKKLSRNERIWM